MSMFKYAIPLPNPNALADILKRVGGLGRTGKVGRPPMPPPAADQAATRILDTLGPPVRGAARPPGHPPSLGKATEQGLADAAAHLPAERALASIVSPGRGAARQRAAQNWMSEVKASKPPPLIGGDIPPPAGGFSAGTVKPPPLPTGATEGAASASGGWLRPTGATALRAGLGGATGAAADATMNDPAGQEWLRDMGYGGLADFGAAKNKTFPGRHALTALGAFGGGGLPFLRGVPGAGIKARMARGVGHIAASPATQIGIGTGAATLGVGAMAGIQGKQRGHNQSTIEAAEAKLRPAVEGLTQATNEATDARDANLTAQGAHRAAEGNLRGVYHMQQDADAMAHGTHKDPNQGAEPPTGDAGPSLLNRATSAVGNIPNWGKALGIGGAALGGGYMANRLLSPKEEDEEEGGGSMLPTLAGAGVGLGGAALGAHYLTGGDYGKLLNKDFWTQKGACALSAYPYRTRLLKQAATPGLPDLTELTDTLPFGNFLRPPSATPPPLPSAPKPSPFPSPAATPTPGAGKAAPLAPPVASPPRTPGRAPVPGAGVGRGDSRGYTGGDADPVFAGGRHREAGYESTDPLSRTKQPGAATQPVDPLAVETGSVRNSNMAGLASGDNVAGRTSGVAPSVAPAGRGAGSETPGVSGAKPAPYADPSIAPGARGGWDAETHMSGGAPMGHWDEVAKQGITTRFDGDPEKAMAAGLESLQAQGGRYAPPEVQQKGPQGIMEWVQHIWGNLSTTQKVLLGMGLGLGAIGLMSSAGGMASGQGPGVMGPLLGLGGLAGAGYLAYQGMKGGPDSSGGLEANRWQPMGGATGAAGTTPPPAAPPVAAPIPSPEALAAEEATLAANPVTAAYFKDGKVDSTAIGIAILRNPASLRPAITAMSPGMKAFIAQKVSASSMLPAGQKAEVMAMLGE